MKWFWSLLLLGIVIALLVGSDPGVLHSVSPLPTIGEPWTPSPEDGPPSPEMTPAAGTSELDRVYFPYFCGGGE